MAALISRRLSAKSNILTPSLSACFFSINTCSPRLPSPLHSSDLYHPNPDLNHQKPNIPYLIKFSYTCLIGGSTAIHKPYQGLRFFSTPNNGSNPKEEQVEDGKPSSGSGSERTLDGFKHQEIEGPTVERDLSSLANETREVMERLMKNMYGVSNVLGVFGLVQLGLGAWISYTTTRSAPPVWEITLMSAVAFGFPFSMALMLRQSLKAMHFFKKMEELGRLQILTSTMQMTKHLNLFFVRLRGVSYLCIAGLSAGTLLLVFAR